MSDAVEAKFAILAQGFSARLPARLDAMDLALAHCRRDPADRARWEELHRLLHSLGGAAGSFGLPALGLAARAVEELIARHQGDWDEAQMAAVAAALAGLRA